MPQNPQSTTTVHRDIKHRKIWSRSIQLGNRLIHGQRRINREVATVF
jgi:hypothetical protein